MKNLVPIIFGIIGLYLGWVCVDSVYHVDDSSQVGNSEPTAVVDTKPATEPPTQQPDAITPSPAPSLITDGPTPLTEEEFADLQQWLRDKKPLQEWIDAHPPKEFSAKDVARLVEQVAPEVPSVVQNGTATFFCPTCKGAGTYYGALCPTCDGASAVQFPPRASQSVSTPTYYNPPVWYYLPQNGSSGSPRGFRGVPVIRRLRRH